MKKISKKELLTIGITAVGCLAVEAIINSIIKAEEFHVIDEIMNSHPEDYCETNRMKITDFGLKYKGRVDGRFTEWKVLKDEK